jgi:acyl-CoA dehydrogenase
MVLRLAGAGPSRSGRFLVPLVNAEKRICFSITERAADSDATGMRTTAVRDGEDWVLNGEKVQVRAMSDQRAGRRPQGQRRNADRH